jgi:pyruvate ferredoxin oxidoreductase beta subunit
VNAAVDSLFWPLYEVVDGSYRLTYRPDKAVPVEQWPAPRSGSRT